MLRIPRVLSVYAAGTAERRWHLANYREQPDGDQSELHDPPLGMASICPTSAEFGHVDRPKGNPARSAIAVASQIRSCPRKSAASPSPGCHWALCTKAWKAEKD